MSGLIDCDVHFSVPSLQDLLPYLDPASRDLVQHSSDFGLTLPTYPWQHPTGWTRKDTFSADTLPGTSLRLLREQLLDRYDVRYGILTPEELMCVSVLPNLHLAAALASAHNDWMIDHLLEQDKRLRGSLLVAAHHPESAAREIRRLGGRDDIVQVILPGGSRIPYGNPFYDPLWRAAHEMGLAVAIHVYYEGMGIAAAPVTAAGMPDFYCEYHALLCAANMGHLASILYHGILERFPGQRVVLVESGVTWVAGFLWRLDQDWRSCRSETPWCRRPPSEYVWEGVRFTTQPLEEPNDMELLRGALAGMHPAETLMFASDYPHWDFDEPTLTLRTLPKEWRDNVAFANARQLYGLPAAESAGVGAPA
ncbi:MAG TPA: amidohydrolase family protein [Chloroflexota bacterium]|nr:amidohydrolase family protein [Chloroflexota bacterium]